MREKRKANSHTVFLGLSSALVVPLFVVVAAVRAHMFSCVAECRCENHLSIFYVKMPPTTFPSESVTCLLARKILSPASVFFALNCVCFAVAVAAGVAVAVDVAANADVRVVQGELASPSASQSTPTLQCIFQSSLPPRPLSSLCASCCPQPVEGNKEKSAQCETKKGKACTTSRCAVIKEKLN